MKLIVGLGNPGTAYLKTRHNIGSAVVKALAAQEHAALKRGLFSRALNCRVTLAGKPALLAVPLAYMNESGVAVAALARKHRVPHADILVVVDDVELELGSLRLKASGSSGGHNGLKSVIACLGTDRFCRLRIGISRPRDSRIDLAEYVLKPFTKSEGPAVAAVTETACQAIASWCGEGTEKTMNLFNRE